MVSWSHHRDANLICHWHIVGEYPVQISSSRGDHFGRYSREACIVTHYACGNGCWSLRLHHRLAVNRKGEGKNALGVCLYSSWGACDFISCWRNAISPLGICLVSDTKNGCYHPKLAGWGVGEIRRWSKELWKLGNPRQCPPKRRDFVTNDT